MPATQDRVSLQNGRQVRLFKTYKRLRFCCILVAAWIGVALLSGGAIATPPLHLSQISQPIVAQQEPSSPKVQADEALKAGIEQYWDEQFSVALDTLTQALALYQQLQDRPGEAMALEHVGLAHRALGDYDPAMQAYEQVLGIARELGDRTTEASALASLGTVYRIQGRYADALDFHRQALDLMEAQDDQAGVGRALMNLGNVHIVLGNYDRAVYHYERSLAIARTQGDARTQAFTLNSLGTIHAGQGDYDQAQQAYVKSIQLLMGLNQKATLGEVLNNLGSIYHRQGNAEQALKTYGVSLKIAKTMGNRRLEAAALGAMGSVHSRLTEYETAADYQQQSLAIAQTLNAPNLTALTLNNLGHTLWKAGQATQAETKLWNALDYLDALRASDLADADKVSIFDTQVHTYNLLQQILIDQGRPEDALEVAERGRARAFVELLSKRVGGEDSKRPLSGVVGFVAPKGLGERWLGKLANSSRDAAQTTPLSQRVAGTTTPTIDQIRQIARTQNATLVEYSLIPDDTFVGQGKLKGENLDLFIWVVQPDGAISFRQMDLRSLSVPLQEMVANSRVSIGVGGRGIGIEVRDDVDVSDELQQLHTLLIEPIADLLPTDPTKRVVFLPQDALFLVPFPALRDEAGEYLVEHHTVLTAPSIQVLGLTHALSQVRAAQRSESPGRARGGTLDALGRNALIVGNPTMPTLPGETEPLPALPGAEAEAVAIANFLNAEAILGDQATEAAVLERMPEARLIHFATHGLLEYGQPAESGVQDAPGAVALTPVTSRDSVQAELGDGLLTASEILDLDLQAELVVLSACDTGRGKITGDGVIGLSRSLISAGAPSVVVSLWQVPDEPTQFLMTEFYRQMEQTPDKAQALRQAMLVGLAQYPNPRNWAAFTLIGEAEGNRLEAGT